jgi:gluconate 2-dehydrogenase gamma chain
MPVSTRRRLLAATALVNLSPYAPPVEAARGMPWSANEAYPPTPVRPGPWLYFTADEAAAVEAIVDRLIPADDLSPGGKEAGCAVFIDRQLMGPFGTHEWLYMQGPFPANPLPSQGMQSPFTPRQQYRLGLAALAEHCRAQFGGRTFAQLAAADQDKVLTDLEKGDLRLTGFSGQMLFNTILANTMEGFFADPIYGGNKDMCGWKLVGFPGTRYDFRDVIANPNRRYTMPPVSLQGRPEWNRTAG